MTWTTTYMNRVVGLIWIVFILLYPARYSVLAFTPITGGEVSDYELSGVPYRVHEFKETEFFVSTFDDNTLQGWQRIRTSTMSGGPSRWDVDGMSATTVSPHGGPYAIAPVPLDVRDIAHHTLVLRSPPFRIGSQTTIHFALVGGTGVSSSPGANSETLPAQSSTSGFVGVVLRRVHDNAYVTNWRRSSSSNTWQVFNILSNQLSSFVSLNDEILYTIDLVDTYHGSWGWMAMDSFSINGIPGVLSVSQKAVGIPFSVLLVGGGGPGGRSVDRTGGGGGGGGVAELTTTFLSGIYDLMVGNGGTGSNNGRMSSINHRSTNSLVASVLGGGRGGTLNVPPTASASGGGSFHGSSTQLCPSGSTSRCGGAGHDPGSIMFAAGGGGGAGGNGISGSSNGGGNGGIGIASSIRDGTEEFFGGGGGGGAQNLGSVFNMPIAEGGLGGGGRGGIHGSSLCQGCLQGLPGEPNTGGGGGGEASCGTSSCPSAASAPGGSGIIIVRYVSADPRLSSLQIADADSHLSIVTDPVFTSTPSGPLYANVLSTINSLRITPVCVSSSCSVSWTSGGVVSNNETFIVPLGDPGSETTIEIVSTGFSGSFSESYTLTFRKYLGISRIDAIIISSSRLFGIRPLSPPFVSSPSGTYQASVPASQTSIFVTPWSGSDGNTLVWSNLVALLDASDPSSYPGTGTSWIDLSGWNRNGAIQSGASFSSSPNPRFVLTGQSNSFVVLPGVPFTGSGTTSFSLGVWVRPMGVRGNIVMFSASNPPDGWNMPPITAENGRFSARIWQNDRIYSTSTFTLGEWYYLVLVWRYSSTSSERGQFFYVNGELQGSQTGIEYSGSGVNNAVFLGRSNPGFDNEGMFTGDIGVFQVYGQRALTHSEVMQNYLAYRSRFELRTSFMSINGVTIRSGVSRSFSLPEIGAVKQINVTGDSDDGTSSFLYTINVKRMSNDALLSFMQLRIVPSGEIVPLSPVFEENSAQRSFSASVAAHVSQVTIVPTCRDPFCLVSINYQQFSSGSEFLLTLPQEGSTTSVLIQSLSEDQTVAISYSVSVRRKYGNPRVSTLLVRTIPGQSLVSLSPPFNSMQDQIMVGTVHPRFETASLFISCEVPICFLRINGIEVQNQQILPVTLSLPGNDVEIRVDSTSEDELQVQTYHILLHRYHPPSFAFVPVLHLQTESNEVPPDTDVLELTAIQTFVPCTSPIQMDHSIPGVDHTMLSLGATNIPNVWLVRSSQAIAIPNDRRTMRFSALVCDFHIVGSIYFHVQNGPNQKRYVSIEHATISITL